MSVDPGNTQKIYAGSEHSGLFYTKNAGARWQRCRTQHAEDDALLRSRAQRRRAGRNDPVGGLSQQERQAGKNWKACGSTAPARIFRLVRSCSRAPAISHLIRPHSHGFTPASKSAACSSATTAERLGTPQRRLDRHGCPRNPCFRAEHRHGLFSLRRGLLSQPRPRRSLGKHFAQEP